MHDGNIRVDASIIAELPQGCRIISFEEHGASFWSNTARINVELGDQQSIKSFFIKILSNEIGKCMVQGEFESMKAIYSLRSGFVPKPIAWGSFRNTPDTHFFLCEYREMSDKMPDPEEFTGQLARLHQDSQSPTGKFGFHITTYNGNLPQLNHWEDSWETYFANIMRRALELELAAKGPDPEFDTLIPVLFDKVIPRLLRPLESAGRSVKPSLVHGDLWYANSGVDISTNTSLIFDACCFYAHNEYEFGQWMPTCNRFGAEYLSAYHAYVPKSPPEEDYQGRLDLYKLRFNTHVSALFTQDKQLREQMLGNLRDLVARYDRRFAKLGLCRIYEFPPCLGPKKTSANAGKGTSRGATFPRAQRLAQERLEKLIIGEDITDAEKEVLVEVLSNREGALAWKEIGRVHNDLAPPQKIRTVPHVRWQAKSFPIPKALEPVTIERVREKLSKSLFERGHGPYRNPYFPVKKKRSGEYRLVIAAQNINKVTVRDANLPPSSDDFGEEFTGMWMTSILDWLSGYDQIELDKDSRDGATNSVAQFVRITNDILRGRIPDRTRLFLGDIAIKGPKTDYGQQEVAPGIRKYVLEHIQDLDEVRLDLERAGATIAGPKLQLCVVGIEVVGYICDKEGRHPQEMTADPLYSLLRKNAPWVWSPIHTEAMEALKLALTTPPALTSLDYRREAGDIAVAVDAILRGWGARGLLKVLKKFKRWLYSVSFVVETDAVTLAAQLNRQSTDLPGAVVNQWLAWIRGFAFDVRYVLGKNNVVADALSRRPRTQEDLEEAEEESDIDDWLEVRMLVVRASIRPIKWKAGRSDLVHVRPPRIVWLFEDGYTDESTRLAKFLRDNERPQATHNDSRHRGREATNKRVSDRYFWVGQWKDVPTFCKTCIECQCRDGKRLENETTPSLVDARWEQISVDPTTTPASAGSHYLVEARSQFSGWVEARGTAKANSAILTKFLWEEIICRRGVFRRLLHDGGPENKGWAEALANRYGTKRVISSTYHPPTNGQVES
ncbi:uncharacterized protein PV07_12622 [Cladophialophora immunda]|uniref:protein-ribulosamine 3-kinase n=1 Tax=Cladophialophora immunda TaxID=569365 RepID=A0A0D2BU89_9EURO|nr:uncharacterized protein PV07_12622 [Cladophialophora immunda]KIW21975.1 hypothetical protein PV07_12622 [Cladophialophora immunda]